VEKYGIAGHDSVDNIIRRIRFACWITKATDTHPEYVIIFHGKNGYLNLLSATFIRSLHCLSCFIFLWRRKYTRTPLPPPSG